MIIVVVEARPEEVNTTSKLNLGKVRVCSVPYVQYTRIIRREGREDRLQNVKRICLDEIIRLHSMKMNFQIKWEDEDLRHLSTLLAGVVPSHNDHGKAVFIHNNVLSEAQRKIVMEYVMHLHSSARFS